VRLKSQILSHRLAHALALALTLVAAGGSAQAQQAPIDRSADVLIAGHEPMIDPSLKRLTGRVTALGAADAKGLILSFKAIPIGPKADLAAGFEPLSGWRVTVLAGKRFGDVFEVKSSTPDEITVTSENGSLAGLEPKDVFVVEQIGVTPPVDDGSGSTASAPTSMSSASPVHKRISG
jgi:hypothetical protein